MSKVHRRRFKIDLPHPSVFSARAAQIVTMLLAVLLAYEGAVLTWLVLPVGDTVDTNFLTDSSNPTPPRHQARAKETPHDLASLHLFGNATLVNLPLPIENVTAPTRLPLILRGVLASSDNRYARALIANDRGVELSFASGALVFGEVALETIQPDCVVIRNGDQRERLCFSEDQEIKINPASPDGPEVIAELEPESEKGPTVQTPLRESRSAESLHEFSQYLADHPHALASLTENPAKTDSAGRVVGYSLDAANIPSYLRRLGLRPGDILTAVNDIPLHDTRKISELATDVMSTKEIQIHYTRRGQLRVIALGAF